MKLSVSPEPENLTPQWAAELLRSGANPRGKHPHGRVDAYARLMRSKRWKPHSIVLLDGSGKLLDGFGRCEAVVKSQVTVQVIVVRGYDEGSIDIIDGNKVRDPAALLRLDGVSQPQKVRPLIAGIMRLPDNDNLVLLNSDYQPLYELYAKPLTALREICAPHSRGLPPVSTQVAFLKATISRPADAERILAGLDRLITLDWQPGDDNLRLLARSLKTDRGLGGGYNTRMTAYLKAAHALNCWLGGTTLKSLKTINQDPFPIESPF